MPKINYRDKNFRAGTLETIAAAAAIIAEYDEQGFTITLRQLYYQFVARGWIANKQTEYDRLGSIINDGRLAGYLDWSSLEDRTREVRRDPTWDGPVEAMEAIVDQYRRDNWENQPVRPEVWIEKDALIGVIEPICKELEVARFSCRGYVSQSEMWRAGVRFRERLEKGQRTVVLHLGDHDPSGIDMTWDIWKRLAMFAGHYTWESIEKAYAPDEAFGETCFDRAPKAPKVFRLALNFFQVEEHNPPPNPAKFTDSRVHNYVDKFGRESWELDALDPTTLAGLIEEAVLETRDDDLWQEALDQEGRDLDKLSKALFDIKHST